MDLIGKLRGAAECALMAYWQRRVAALDAPPEPK